VGAGAENVFIFTAATDYHDLRTAPAYLHLHLHLQTTALPAWQAGGNSDGSLPSF
jgi:hypothetical protein